MIQLPEDPNTLSLAFSEELYASWLEDPESVPSNWQMYFQRLAVDPQVPPSQVAAMGQREAELAVRQNRVDQLIRNFRVRGHRIAHLNPLGEPMAPPPELTLEYYGFGEGDLELPFSSGTLGDSRVLPLKEIVRILRATYSRSIGVQFMHIDDLECREWLQERMEGTENRIQLDAREQTRILAQADRRGHLRGVHPEEVRRGQAVLARGRREPHPAARSAHRARRRTATRARS